MNEKEIIELSKKIEENDKINSYYEIEDYTNINPEYLYKIQREKFNYNYEEKWENYPHQEEIKVSNYGRIKYNGKLLWYSDKGFNKGYLYLRDWKTIQDELKFRFEDDYIYQMVAKTWLPQPEKCMKCSICPLEIHHKTNNGYDNSIKNLVYLTKCEHNEVHRLAKERV